VARQLLELPGVGSDDRWGTSFQEVDSGYRVDTVGVEEDTELIPSASSINGPGLR
jgi:hypothetical protein